MCLKDGLDSHCDRARAAGAEIVQEPVDQFYGERQYRARDPEGHVWTFSQTVRLVPREEAERLGDLQIVGSHR
ncbi:Glyoxalase (fragment) [Mesorhizobium prunaredense]|uniref:Glyoxalase n=1 Tax=Mesorhizobium prunaredense TaxID=1631249 RepID=A0A1R3V7J7_9HYPH